MTELRPRAGVSKTPQRALTLALRLLPWLGVLVLFWNAAISALHIHRAAGILQRFSDTESSADWGGEELRYDIDGPLGAQAVIEYRPSRPRGAVVVVHGIHAKGIHEPRLVRLCRALAAAGYAVLAPEIVELSSYRIEASAVPRIAAATRFFARRMRRPVGVIGTSFAGGLSMLATRDPAVADDVSAVLSVGGHGDVARVARFLVTDEARNPDGSPVQVPAHEYGTLVFLHTHAERLFPLGEQERAAQVLRHWLHEDREAALSQLSALHGETHDRLQALLEHHERGRYAREILLDLESHRDETRAASPSAWLAEIRAPLYLLHGAGDAVIPASETLHLAADAPDRVRASLVSNAIVHVEVGKSASAAETWKLLKFFAEVLTALEARR